MQNKPEDIENLEKRIAALKQKRQKKEKSSLSSDVFGVAAGLRLGVELASGTLVGLGIGYMLDKLFDFKFIMLLIFTILGFFAGMLNAYRYAKNIDEGNK